MLPILLLQEFGEGGGGGGIAGAISTLFVFAIWLLMIVSSWKIFDKAGEPGWAAIVPIYNIVVLLKIIGRPIWWLLLMFIPVVNFIVGILLVVDLAKSFGQGIGYALGLLFLSFIFWPMLAFGDARYTGPAAA